MEDMIWRRYLEEKEKESDETIMFIILFQQILANHQPALSELPEELRDLSSNQPISILRTSQPFNQSPTKFLDHTDVPLVGLLQNLFFVFHCSFQ